MSALALQPYQRAFFGNLHREAKFGLYGPISPEGYSARSAGSNARSVDLKTVLRPVASGPAKKCGTWAHGMPGHVFIDEVFGLDGSTLAQSIAGTRPRA
jgi:hypothetical protein